MSKGGFVDLQQGYYPSIVTTAGTNVYVNPASQVVAPAAAPPEPERSPLEWLRDEVGEVCDLARVA